MFGRPLRIVLLGLAFLAAGVAPALSAGDDAFAKWLEGVRREGRGKGITEATLDLALADLRPIPRVIELDRRQPEFSLTYDEYMGRVVSPARVRKGRLRLARHADLLAKVEARYGVQPRFVVALWGIETDFGRLSGGFPVIAAVATLAYDGRRSAYFRRELFAALRILDEGHVTLERMTGSWAGAMGQNQFMPTSFARYAVDFDGDGRRDIWTSRADVFASAANYLARSGWRRGETWGHPVAPPEGFDPGLAGLESRRPLGEWRRLGVRLADGHPLPAGDGDASLVLPAGAGGPAFLVRHNFRVLLKWNRSTLFALAVGRLADRIAAK